MNSSNNRTSTLDSLIEMMKAIRGTSQTHPKNKSCLWSKQQTNQTLKKHLLEECHEVIEAIDESSHRLEEELGDLFYQILFFSQIAQENNLFNLETVLQKLYSKMTRRHPHVFGNKEANSLKDVSDIWTAIKKSERQSKE